jgi:hypothetical protein
VVAQHFGSLVKVLDPTYRGMSSTSEEASQAANLAAILFSAGAEAAFAAPAETIAETVASTTATVERTAGAAGQAADLGAWEVPAVPEQAVERVNLASAARTNHVLYGEPKPDGSWGGGHQWPGNPGKTSFPYWWSGDDIMEAISDIATDPSTIWQGGGPGGSLYTKANNPARFTGFGVRDGVRIKVVTEPAGEGIITGFPQP